jgi:Domain of unknown function (DUF5127)/Domain of unknown function (DUF4965)/Domain of unknown function (DUF1793)/Domain of unknown function (DUF4964)
MPQQTRSDRNVLVDAEEERETADTRSFSRRTFLKASAGAVALPAGLGLFGVPPSALADDVDRALGGSAAGLSALPSISLGGAAVRPPSVPLAVRSPYMSTWLPATELTSTTPQFWYGNNRGFNGLVDIDGTAYAWAGQPQVNGTVVPALSQTSLQVTATRSIFTANAGGVQLVAEFLSPIEPGDLRRTSVPFTLLTVSVSAIDQASHEVQVYADITGEWVSSVETDPISWNTVTSGANRYWTIQLQNPTPLSETSQMADWGTAVWGAPRTANQTYQAGYADDVWAQFAANRSLANSVDPNFRAIDSNQPVFAFAYDLGTVGGRGSWPELSVSFAIGHVRTPILSYGPDATPILPWWTKYWSDWTGPADFFLEDADAARERATALDVRIQGASIYAVDEGYSAATALAARQCYGGFELGIGPDGEPWLLGKEISSDGDDNTVDIWDQAYLMFLYLDPALIPLEMEPILTWCASDGWQDPSLWSSIWSNADLKWAAAQTRYCVHDLGVYPTAPGRAPGTDEMMPIEECAGMLIMAASYARQVGRQVAQPFLAKWQLLWTQWAQLLLTQVPTPDTQLTTDDWAPTYLEPTGSTNLGLKAIIGLAAAAQIATILGDQTNSAAWSQAAQGNVAQWAQLSLDPSGNYLNLEQGATGTWSTIYNGFYEMVIGEQLVPESIKALQAGFYLTKLQPYGLPLQTDTTLTKVAWNFYIPAWLRDYEIATALYNRDAQYINDTPSLVPYGDRYDTGSAVEVAGIKAHPTLGAVYAGLFAKTPPVATTVSPLSVLIAPGGSAGVTLTNTNVSQQTLEASWTATPPADSGMTVNPGSGSASLLPGRSADSALTVAVDSSAAPGQTTIPIAVSAAVGGSDALVPGSYVQVTVPYGSLEAALNNVGVTDTNGYVPSSTVGNFDGYENSYSQEALAAATAPDGSTVSIVPGGQVTAQGLTFTWPGAAAGNVDNVLAAGQMIALSGSGSQIGFLGAAVNSPGASWGASELLSGTGTITYTDGTTDQITIEFPNWVYPGPLGTTSPNLVATCDSGGYKGSGDDPGPGRPNRTPSLFIATAPTDTSKTVAAITLPTGASTVEAGTASLHIFALATV